MTAVTHQMMALLAALWVLISVTPSSPGVLVAIMAVVAVMIGALTPDLDQPTANVWRRMLGGKIIGNVFQAFSGGHRHMTHSLLGIVGIGWLLWLGIHRYLQPDFWKQSELLWRAFMIGYISHPIADTLTDRGVPWLWPLRWHVRIPPGPEELRVTTDSWVERILVRGAVMLAIGLLLVSRWSPVLDFFKA